MRAPAPYSTGRAPSDFAALISHVPMALALVDAERRLLASNEAMRATAGTPEPGQRAEALVIAADAPTVAGAIRQALTGGTPATARVRLATRPEEPTDLQVLPLPPGLGAAALLGLRDIREQLRLEAQVAAGLRMQAVGQLAGGIAHDFNNLLTAMLGLADQLLERLPAGSAEAQTVAEIQRNGHRGADLVRQLLGFARRQPQRRVALDPALLVRALRPLMSQLLGPAVELVIDTASQQWVEADPGQLEQVLVNLAVNARDAMDGNGRLTISLKDVAADAIEALGHRIMPAMAMLEITVTDTGSGIPPALAARIFEPFFTTKPQGQGTGLGLSTAYGIIKQSEGFIFVAPGPGGRGTTFTIYLPGRMADTARATAAVPVTPVPTIPPAAGLCVLLVEDEAAVRSVFVRALERNGCNVTAAEDGMAALSILGTDRHFDVLVSDVMMPGIDGVDLAMEAARVRPGIGIVLMSGYAELPRHRLAHGLGVQFLAKPFAMADLLAALSVSRPAQGVASD